MRHNELSIAKSISKRWPALKNLELEFEINEYSQDVSYWMPQIRNEFFDLFKSYHKFKLSSNDMVWRDECWEIFPNSIQDLCLISADMLWLVPSMLNASPSLRRLHVGPDDNGHQVYENLDGMRCWPSLGSFHCEFTYPSLTWTEHFLMWLDRLVINLPNLKHFSIHGLNLQTVAHLWWFCSIVNKISKLEKLSLTNKNDKIKFNLDILKPIMPSLKHLELRPMNLNFVSISFLLENAPKLRWLTLPCPESELTPEIRALLKSYREKNPDIFIVS